MPDSIKIEEKTDKKRAEDLGVEFLESAPKKIAEGIIGIIPKEVAEKHRMVVFEKSGNALKVAMADPQNIDALNVLRFFAEKEKMEIAVHLVSDENLKDMLNFYSGPTEFVKEAVKSFQQDAFLEESGQSGAGGQKKEEILKDAPVTKLV
ncbi:MAG TPA: hypothetical protein DIT25_01575 [Candidatus Moranbacteria bacterium]|nr:hypothetical protein [Candidatus Moranbacteria bacterium]